MPDAPGFYMTDAFTDNALSFLDRYAGGDKPFFLYLAYTARTGRCTLGRRTSRSIAAGISAGGIGYGGGGMNA
ncbi:hypothetical protein HS125_04885 [bacterium]|nr:hypothetical protein [bacterium]